MKPLIVIPARGGSKGVPRKNIKLLDGKPLIQYTLEAALGVFPQELVFVSTDDEEIKAVVEQLGVAVPCLRPAAFSTDQAGSYEVLKHALSVFENQGYFADTLILLQPTSPFRNAKHLQEAYHAYHMAGADMLVSVKEAKSNPYFVLFEEDGNGFLVKSKNGNFSSRQDCPDVWEYNGAIYIIDVKALQAQQTFNLSKIKKYVMDSSSSVDIDTELDWRFAEFLLVK